MLTACTAASVGINAQILRVDLDIQIFFDIRHNIQRYEGGLALALGVEGGNPDKTVYAFFRFQIAVSVLTVYLEGNGLDARFFAVQIVQNFHGKALFLRPSGIHTVQHAAPVAALCAACARIEL